MITSLQNFISSKGKFVFVLLLFLVVVSFVLYLSQGSSVFDLIPDPNRERKEFYGYDWNDPDQRRSLSIANRVAADFGSVVSPGEEVLQTAEEDYLQNLQGRMQAAFQGGEAEMDRDALQQMFSYMQAWPNFPNDMKAREIARSGNYGQDFLQAVIEYKVALAGQADSWGLMPLHLNHPAINSRFAEYLNGLAPGMDVEENRTRALSFVGSRHGVSGRDAESILYDSFRTRQVERIYLDSGYALEEEVRADLHTGQFAWDGEVAKLRADDLSFQQPAWRVMQIKSLPKVNESINVKYGSNERRFIFVKSPRDENGTTRFVSLGKALPEFRKNLQSTLNGEDFGFECKPQEKNSLALIPKPDRLPLNTPSISSTSKQVVLVDGMSAKLREFHNERKVESPFAKLPRTFASATIFSSAKFLTEPGVPDEARLRSYFERNQLDFTKPAPTEPSNDGNNSTVVEKTVSQTFEEAREEVSKRVIARDKEDARRDADLQARDAALAFLDKLNGLRDKLRSKYSTFNELRNSAELASMIEDAGARAQKISFSREEMGTQAMVLGLERRESERRANREPLEEVENLNERMFFTRSVRKSRQGYVVFILDHKTPQQPGSYEDAKFSDLYRGYTAEAAGKYFSDQIDAVLAKLQAKNKKPEKPGNLRLFKTVAKSPALARAGFDAKARTLGGRIQKVEEERQLLTSADANASGNQTKIKKLDDLLKSLRQKIKEGDEERAAIMGLLETAQTLTVDGNWQELERNGEEATFVRLTQVYSLISKESTEEAITQRRVALEAKRGQASRDLILGDLVSAGLGSSR